MILISEKDTDKHVKLENKQAPKQLCQNNLYLVEIIIVIFFLGGFRTFKKSKGEGLKGFRSILRIDITTSTIVKT